MENRSTEDYIKGIYHLLQHDPAVATTDLARHLKVGNGSVTDMLKKLARKHLINYERYRGVTLTKSGERLALKMVRRHRLWEMFLVKFLGYSWDEIHDEAEHLEHVTSDELERRIDKALGHPTVDPHGDPIPTTGGVIRKKRTMPLADCEAGAKLEILRVSDENSDVLQHAEKLGLTLNAKFSVLEKKSFDGSMVLKIGMKPVFISERVAQSIFVQPI